MLHDDNDSANKIYICRAARCKKNGSDEIVELLEKVLKSKIDKDVACDQIQLSSTFCLGQCSFGPNVRANNKIYNGVDKQILKRILVILKSRLAKT